jgi:hypothetical protein
MTVPTQGEEFSKLLYHITEAQNSCATLSHLAGLNANRNGSPREKAVHRGWLLISEQLKAFQKTVTLIAMGKMQ